MSGVIKAGMARSVRALDLRSVGAGRVELVDAPVARSPAELELDDARQQIARLEARLVAIDKERGTERDEAYAAGLKEGAESADDGTERRLAQLRAAGDTALDAWRGRVGELDILAAMLARGAMAKVFSPHADLADLVSRAIAGKLAQLRTESVVAIRVSGADFAEPSALAAVSSGVAVMVDPVLKSGACHIDLRLGEVDLTIDGLARGLDDFFRSLDEPA